MRTSAAASVLFKKGAVDSEGRVPNSDGAALATTILTEDRIQHLN